MKQVTKEAIEQGRKVRNRAVREEAKIIAAKVMWLEAPNGDTTVAVWWFPHSTPTICNPLTLELVPEPERREMWLNVYPDNDGWLYATKEQADKASGPSRLGPAIRVPLISTDGGKTWGVDYEGGRG